MSRKLTFKDIELFIKENSSCDLLSDKYINIDSKLLFKCACDNHFETSFYNFRNKNKRQCNSCSGITNWNIETVKEYVFKNSNCKLLSNNYQNNLTKLDFVCSCGNIFTTDFSSFLFKNKRDCNECNSFIIYTFEDVQKFVEENGCKVEDFNYSNARTKLNIRCKCGNYFSASFSEFKFGKRQCNKCSGKIYCDIESVRSYVNNKTDCELLSDNYIESNGILEFKCRCGKKFKRSFASFKRTNHCNKCSKEAFLQKVRKTQEEFEKQVYELYGEEYTVIGKYVNHTTKIEIKHNVCNNIWMVAPSGILSGNECPKCLSSKGEKSIEKYLIENNIKYQPQFRFENCRNIKPLPFDFAIFDDKNTLIQIVEYDGQMHYIPNDFYGGQESLEQTQYRDSIKTNYCQQNNIPLLRIPYWDFSRIEEILSKELNIA